MEDKNPKIPGTNQDAQGLPRNPQNNPPPPSSVIPLNDKNLENFVSILEKMGNSIEKSNQLLMEKKELEEKTGEFTQEEKEKLEEVKVKLEEEVSYQQDILSEMQEIKRSLLQQGDSVSVGSSNTNTNQSSPKSGIANILKKENNVLSSLNANITELKTLQDEVREVFVKKYEKTVPLDSSMSNDVAKNTVEEIRTGNALDEKEANLEEKRHQELLNKLNTVYTVNKEELETIKRILEGDKTRFQKEIEDGLEAENIHEEALDLQQELHVEMMKDRDEKHEDILDAHEKTSDEVQKLREHHESHLGLFSTLKHIIFTVLKRLTILGGIGLVLGGIFGYFKGYITTTYGLFSSLGKRLGIMKLLPEGFSLTKKLEAIARLARMRAGAASTAVFGGMSASIATKLGSIATQLERIPAIGGFLGRAARGMNIFGGARSAGFIGSILGVPLAGILSWFGYFPALLKTFRFASNLVSKAFLPIQILLSTIDAVTGAIKGFKLGGIKGAIMGAVAQIISGLTFGLLDFEMMFKFFSNYMSEIFDGLADVLQPTIDLFIEIWSVIVDIYDDIVGIFSGPGGLMQKIGNLVGTLAGAFIRTVFSLFKFLALTIYNAIWKFPMQVGVWINHTIVRLYEWATSGEWIDDLANFGNWVTQGLIQGFDGMMTNLAGSLTKLPDGVGKLIAGAIGPAASIYYEKAKVYQEEQEKRVKKDEKEKEKSRGNITDFTQYLAVFAKDLPDIFENMFKEDEENPFLGVLQAFGADMDEILKKQGAEGDISYVPVGAERSAALAKPKAEYLGADRLRAAVEGMRMRQQQQQQTNSVVSVNSPTNISNNGSQHPIMVTPVSSRNADPTYYGMGLAAAVAY